MIRKDIYEIYKNCLKQQIIYFINIYGDFKGLNGHKIADFYR
ncbi:hypothetical protein SAMN02745134_00271 [Clostridium acidisoli DSM 12555]|uniref:Uncharacterized protein n=1 Tax=Clostridium acidisoli DSM 12555 TaxID=1121291 RepID=A0A1W1WZV5_9CLOT|nr:hypothetical protein SAMN02745134_00271 [Clostridium acidisoli DSM 12555]